MIPGRYDAVPVISSLPSWYCHTSGSARRVRVVAGRAICWRRSLSLYARLKPEIEPLSYLLRRLQPFTRSYPAQPP